MSDQGVLDTGGWGVTAHETRTDVLVMCRDEGNIAITYDENPLTYDQMMNLAVQLIQEARLLLKVEIDGEIIEDDE